MTEQNPQQGDPKGNKAPKPKTRVEVICKGSLGPLLLKTGDVTDDPRYVALLEDPRGLVREVKSAK